jgi:hypothetical protein
MLSWDRVSAFAKVKILGVVLEAFLMDSARQACFAPKIQMALIRSVQRFLKLAVQVHVTWQVLSCNASSVTVWITKSLERNS